MLQKEFLNHNFWANKLNQILKFQKIIFKMYSIFLLLLSFLFTINSDQCYPNFMVDQVIQNSVSLQFSDSQKKSQSLTKIYNHIFWGDSFTKEPSIIYCISQIEFNITNDISYNLSAIPIPNIIQFILTSNGISWTILNIHLIIKNRLDMFSIIFPLTNPTKNLKTQQKQFSITKSLQLPQNLKLSTESINYQTFLIGVKSKINDRFSNNHQVKISETYTDGFVGFNVKTDNSNFIEQVMVCFVVIETQNKDYITHKINFLYTNFKDTYQLLSSKFQPVINVLFGLRSLSMSTSKTLSIQQAYDLPNSLMHLSTSSTIDFLEYSFLAISRPMKLICSSCPGSSVEIGGCKTTCEADSFLQIYYDSAGLQNGKACVKCLSQVNMVYNSEIKSCICKDGYMMIGSGTKCVPFIIPKQPIITTQPGQIVQPVQITQPVQVIQPVQVVQPQIMQQPQITQQPQKIQQTSPKKSKITCASPDMLIIQQKCKCPQPLIQINKTCGSCPLNTFYDANKLQCFTLIQLTGCQGLNQLPSKDFITCQCKDNYQRNSMRQCVAKCNQNQNRNLLTGLCQCNQGYIVGKDWNCVKVVELTQSIVTVNTTQNNSLIKPAIVNNQIFTANTSASSINQINFQNDINSSSTSTKQNISNDSIWTRPITKANSSQPLNKNNTTITSQSPSMIQKNLSQASIPTATTNPIPQVIQPTQSPILPIQAPSQSIKIILQSPPKYTSPGIILNFIITPAIFRSQSQVDDLFSITFSDRKQAPLQVYLTQSSTNATRFQCFLYYRNSLPYKLFTTHFKVTYKNTQDQVDVIIDVLGNRLKSAIRDKNTPLR